jgi:tetratricopeptide (TPR) repeat protein
VAEDLKKRGNEAYKIKDWEAAVQCYSSALDLCNHNLESELVVACLNNRAACYAQLKEHLKVVSDTALVIQQQPANIKALLRRMVAYDALGQRTQALEDASGVLTMEPKNVHALEIVDKQRKSLTKKGNEDLKRPLSSEIPTSSLSVFLFTENRPLQCYACLLSLAKHMKNARLDVHVMWEASSPECFQSYQMLQCYGETSRLQLGSIAWTEISRGKLFSVFSGKINRFSVEGQLHVLLLSDKVVFHSDVDASAAMKLLRLRNKAHSVRLDMNPRVEYFPEESMCSGAPPLEAFSEDERMLLWTRWYDKSKQAYQSVSREMGWDAILDWTATIVRVEMVQHFFSALMPPPENLKELADRAADWLSRRQRMKCSEVSHRSACFAQPALVTIDPSSLGDSATTDRALRMHLFTRWGSNLQKLAEHIGWKLDEVKKYFKNVQSEKTLSVPLDALLEPELFAEHYFDSVCVDPVPPLCSLPVELHLPSPLVSWLVPARNEEGFINDCFLSIDNQTGIDRGRYEIVLINDASEDSTLALMRKFAEDRPYVRIVDNDAQLGVAGSLCAGWSRCRGDFVARLDADDIAEPERLVKQLRYLERHRSICLLGGRTRSFWTEQRICTVEKVIEKQGDRLAVVAWREDHGNQTSRQREQLTLRRKGDEIIIENGPAEYFGCRAIRVGEESLALSPGRWRTAFCDAEGGVAEVILQRRDPLEQPRGINVLHPMLVRAHMLFEDCIAGTTAMFRRSQFASDGPYQREECETHWCSAFLEPHQHAANIADTLVCARRHADNRSARESAGILESKNAAVQYYLTKVHGVDANMADAAALHNFRGPCTAEQGQKLMTILEHIEKSLYSEYIRPRESDEAQRSDFWKDFVKGREVALERAIVANRMRFKELVNKVSEVITSVPEHSPRPQRERELPR